MKIYVKLFIITLVAFIAGYLILTSFKLARPTELIFEFEIIILSDDTFQLFYQTEGMKSFTEKESVKIIIKGSDKKQRLQFAIPIDNSINSLRLDIGNNKKQEKIEIKDVKLKSTNNSIAYNITDDFKPNNYIKNTDGIIFTHVINAKYYDPYFITKNDLKKDIAKLNIRTPVFKKKISILLSLIFSISIIFVFYYQKIQLKNIYSLLFILGFIIILIAPYFSEFFKLPLESSLQEKRKLAKKPEFEFNETFPQDYEKYFNDNFGLRSVLVKWNSSLKLNYFRVSPKPELALFGKDGFLFYNSINDAIYQSYTNQNSTDTIELEKFDKTQKALAETLSKKNIKYFLGYFPNKHTIYKEKLPVSMKLQIQNNKSLASQLVDFSLKRNIPFTDVSNELFEAKKEHQLYYKFDSHWNAYGAYIAYKSFFTQNFDKLNITPFDTTSFDIKYNKLRSGDLTNMIGIKQTKSHYDNNPVFKLKNKTFAFERVSTEGYPANTVITINENIDNKETVVIFRDSFTTALIPYFSLHFHKVIYILSPEIDMNLIEKENPNIVMSLSVERYLTRLLK